VRGRERKEEMRSGEVVEAEGGPLPQPLPQNCLGEGSYLTVEARFACFRAAFEAGAYHQPAIKPKRALNLSATSSSPLFRLRGRGRGRGHPFPPRHGPGNERPSPGAVPEEGRQTSWSDAVSSISSRA
jgi:hypothetical protein